MTLSMRAAPCFLLSLFLHAVAGFVFFRSFPYQETKPPLILLLLAAATPGSGVETGGAVLAPPLGPQAPDPEEAAATSNAPAVVPAVAPTPEIAAQAPPPAASFSSSAPAVFADAEARVEAKPAAVKTDRVRQTASRRSFAVNASPPRQSATKSAPEATAGAQPGDSTALGQAPGQPSGLSPGQGAAGTSAGPSLLVLGASNGPAVLEIVRPAYPPRAKQLRQEGKVLLKLLIDAAGRVQNVDVVKAAGHGFDDAAAAAARRSQFVPAQRDGRPVACFALLPISFKLTVDR